MYILRKVNVRFDVNSMYVGIAVWAHFRIAMGPISVHLDVHLEVHLEVHLGVLPVPYCSLNRGVGVPQTHTICTR